MKALTKWLLLALLLAAFVVVTSPVATAQGPVTATTYEVVYPYGRPTMKVLTPVARPDTLEGKTVCGLWGGAFHFEETFPVIKDVLAKKYPTAKFIGPDEMGKAAEFKEILGGTGKFASGWDAKNPDLVAKVVKQFKCDVAIVGNGC